MKDNYFSKVSAKTPTKFWINSAKKKEIEKAIIWGAVGITINPMHPAKAIKEEGWIWEPVIYELINSEPNISDDNAADFITERIAERNARMVYHIYKKSYGKYGYAAIQSDPTKNNDFDTLMEYATKYANISLNTVPKIPSTEIGAQVIEELTAKGINTIATMGFSVAQAKAMAEAHARGLRRSKYNARCFVVFIPGIYLDYLSEHVLQKKVDIEPEVLSSSGIILSRRIYKLFKEEKYEAQILLGGTRKTFDITSLIGADLHITHSFDTWVQLVVGNPEVKIEISKKNDQEMINELRNKIEDFRKAYDLDGLTFGQFRDFGPCQKFNCACINGYTETKAEIKAYRKKQVNWERKEK